MNNVLGGISSFLKKFKISDGTNDVDVISGHDGTYQLAISLKGHVCADNTTTIPLDVDEVFTGDWQDTLDYGVITIGIKADQDSAANGLVIQWSADGSNVHDSDTMSVSANAGKTFKYGPTRRYVRVVYTNGGVAQTTFSLETVLRRVYVIPSTHRIQDNIVDDDDGQLNISVLKLRTAQNQYTSGSATASGNFKVSLEELESDVSTNSNTQLKTTLYDEGGIPLSIDDSTESIQTVDYSHHEIHSGSHYYIQGYLELDDTNTYYIKIVTPDNTKWSHFIFEIKSTGICSTSLKEDATGGMTGGSAITPLNNNRNSNNTSGMTFTGGVTSCTGYATLLENDKWGAQGFKESIGGGGGREDELVLKQGAVYCREFVSGADSNIIQFKASWYEHTDKN